jgi:hypothetical protein
MTPQILQITFTFSGTKAQFTTACAPAAEAITAIPGLIWKVWIFNEAEQTAGGVYCFESTQAVTHYLESPIVAALNTNPAFSNIRTQQFGVIESLTAQTRGPIPTQSSLQS